jgi:hypothetical protein
MLLMDGRPLAYFTRLEIPRLSHATLEAHFRPLYARTDKFSHRRRLKVL